MNKANSTVNAEKMTQLDHGGVGEPPMPFYHEGGNKIL